jgi:signal transduction histidine kinase
MQQRHSGGWLAEVPRGLLTWLRTRVARARSETCARSCLGSALSQYSSPARSRAVRGLLITNVATPIRAAIRRIDLPAGLAFALALVVIPLLSGIGLQIYEAVNRPRQLALDRVWIEHTLEVISTAEGIGASARNAERSQRGFLLTGTPRYLEQYQAHAARSRALLERLRLLTVDNPEQQRRIPNLAVALDEWLAQRQEIVDVYTQRGLPAAQEGILSLAGRDTLRTVDAVIDATVDTERDLLTRRQARAEAHERRVGQEAIVNCAIDAALLALGVWLIRLAFHNARNAERQRLEMEQRLNQQLLHAQAALAQTQKMEALGQLTGGVAHDFNNLLHVIRNALTVVQTRLRGQDEEVRHYLEMAQRNTDRAASTTARLLAFSRQQPLDPKPTDLNKLVAGMSDLLRHVLGESISMETVLGAGLWPVAIDKNQLETAIVNLAVNARDATPSSGKLTIETSNAFLDENYAALNAEVKPGQYAMLAVSDTGAGMTQEVAARAFDPFFTTKDVGRGTGLGLSQVFGFVKQSGGHVKIYSEPGQGSTVKMYFSRLVGAVAEQPMEPAPAGKAGRGESILVVEDNDDVRAFTEQLLRDMGYRVTAAADGRRALEVLEQLSGADLLFTDVGLPEGMSGRELAKEALRRWPRLKVLYTTGYARNSIIHHGRLDTGVALVLKPFTQSSLALKVRQVLDQGVQAARVERAP